MFSCLGIYYIDININTDNNSIFLDFFLKRRNCYIFNEYTIKKIYEKLPTIIY